MKNLFFTILSIFIIACSSGIQMIEIFDESILEIIDIYSEIEELADSISLPEGPVWDKASNSLLFTDVMGNKLYKWNEEEGTKEYISPSGNTGYAPNVKGLSYNGLLMDEYNVRLAKIENASSNSPNFTTLIDNYEGGRFNSPNDLTYASNGDIYFTDPSFGFFNLETFQFVDSELKDLDFNGVYKFNVNTNALSLITDQIDLPNGIALSPDEKSLYVNKMAFIDGNRKILKINLESMEMTTFFDGAELPQEDEGNFDGLKVHSSGNIFTSGPGGLLIISPEGKLQGKIDFGTITNCAFDDKEEYLYVTGFVNNPKVYRIKLNN